jgi:hypothetical protein
MSGSNSNEITPRMRRLLYRAAVELVTTTRVTAKGQLIEVADWARVETRLVNMNGRPTLVLEEDYPDDTEGYAERYRRLYKGPRYIS